jgi:Uma2 family endonuclease
MADALQKMSLETFLAWENAHEEKHEFYQGEVFDMVGGLRVHARIIGNLYVALRKQLEGRHCQPFSESSKVQVEQRAIFYPDVFVTCDERDLSTEQIFRYPTFICEVFSPSSALYDQGLKFAAYRKIAELREYLLIDPETRELTLFRKAATGNFELLEFTEKPVLALESIDCHIPRADLFDGC